MHAAPHQAPALRRMPSGRWSVLRAHGRRVAKLGSRRKGVFIQRLGNSGNDSLTKNPDFETILDRPQLARCRNRNHPCSGSRKMLAGAAIEPRIQRACTECKNDEQELLQRSAEAHGRSPMLNANMTGNLKNRATGAVMPWQLGSMGAGLGLPITLTASLPSWTDFLSPSAPTARSLDWMGARAS